MTVAVDPAAVAANVAGVRERVAAAAARAGRDPDQVTLVAVAKLFPAAAVRAVLAAGVADVGENYAKDLEAKAAQVPGVRWHFVGRLQRNKAGVLVRVGALVHSLDSPAGARALGRRAVAAGTTARALVQVEVDDREAAHGVRPADLGGFLDACRAVDGLQVDGLMVMPAPADDPEATRPAFRRTAELAARSGLAELSMGMTADFELAVEEGATLIRIGTALFGPRPTRRAGQGGPGAVRVVPRGTREAAHEPVTREPYDSVRSVDQDCENRTKGRSRSVRRDFCGDDRHSVAGAAQGGRPQVLGQLST